MQTRIKVWHLEQWTKPRESPDKTERPYCLYPIRVPTPQLNRFFYSLVGSEWCWYQRLEWSWQQWMEFLERETVETWVAYLDGSPLGYFELELQSMRSVEISYFGLAPAFIGRGLGKLFLEDALEKAWQLGGERVWLHTCTLDHPSALANYQSRGFKVFRTEEYNEDIPDYPLEPWQGAGKYRS